MSTHAAEIHNPSTDFGSHRTWAYMAAALVAVCSTVVVLTFLDYGVTFDEDWRLTYGKEIVSWYLSRFTDTTALHFFGVAAEGGFTSVLAHIAALVIPIGRHETAHLLIAVFGLLGLVGSYKLGTMVGGRAVGFLSALILAFTPRFYGDMFNNISDVPMASLSVFSLYYVDRLVQSLPNVPRGLVLKLGAVIGLALGLRPGAIILVACFGAGLALWFLQQWLLSGESLRRALASHLWRLTLVFAGVCVTAYLMMLVWWPAAQVRPFYQPAKGLWYATHFAYDIKVVFEGMVLSNRELPWYYLPKWFLITLPEFYFLGLFLGLSLLVRFGLRCGFRTWLRADVGLLLTVIVPLLPLTYAVLATPPDYDGVRHFLFILPPMAVIAAYSIAEVVKHGRGWLRISIMAVSTESLLLTGVDMIRLHPYQYVFFNRLFAGGLETAARYYDTDYWGASYKEGVEWLVAHYPVQAGRRPKVASCLHPVSTSYFLPRDRFEFVGSYHGQHPISARPDIFLASKRWGCDQNETGRVLHTVSRMGVPLLYVIEVDPSARQLTSSASEGR